LASEEYNELNWVGQSKQVRQTRVVTHNFFLFVLFIIPLVLPKSLKAMTYLILVTMRQKQFLFISIIQNKYVYEIKFYCLSILFYTFSENEK